MHMIVKYLPSMVRPQIQSNPRAKSVIALLIPHYSLIGEQLKEGWKCGLNFKNV